MYRRPVFIVFPLAATQHDDVRKLIVDAPHITDEDILNPEFHRDLTRGFAIHEPWLFQADSDNQLACVYEQESPGDYEDLKNKLFDLGYGFDEFDDGTSEGVDRAIRFWRPGLPYPLTAVVDQDGVFVITASAFTDSNCHRAYEITQTSSWVHAFDSYPAGAALLAPLVYRAMPLQ